MEVPSTRCSSDAGCSLPQSRWSFTYTVFVFLNCVTIKNWDTFTLISCLNSYDFCTQSAEVGGGSVCPPYVILKLLNDCRWSLTSQVCTKRLWPNFVPVLLTECHTGFTWCSTFFRYVFRQYLKNARKYNLRFYVLWFYVISITVTDYKWNK